MGSELNFILSDIGQIAVTVQDLDLAIEFYREKLGAPFLFQVPNLAFFDCHGIRLMLGLPESPGAGSVNSVIYFKVADIENAYQTLTDRGVPFTDDPHIVAKMSDHDLWMAFFRDPDGNNLALMSEKQLEVEK
ncbi:MAG: VOC family protein [Anaerolineae bacterium]|nr:VOC family protein [Anaerolineae bacterium]